MLYGKIERLLELYEKESVSKLHYSYIISLFVLQNGTISHIRPMFIGILVMFVGVCSSPQFFYNSPLFVMEDKPLFFFYRICCFLLAHVTYIDSNQEMGN